MHVEASIIARREEPCGDKKSRIRAVRDARDRGREIVKSVIK
jgi:hypothetical protein